MNKETKFIISKETQNKSNKSRRLLQKVNRTSRRELETNNEVVMQQKRTQRSSKMSS